MRTAGTATDADGDKEQALFNYMMAADWQRTVPVYDK